ncbi:hypothetical protein TNCV_3832791 [Trichonephila clavipes]|nr:hypothetical protein TNCV_3832791 [Trichonephila clavipes]
MVNQARYKKNRSIQFSFGVVMLSCKVAASSSRNVGVLDSRKPSSPTSSGSNTIRFWSPKSLTGAGSTFATQLREKLL